MDYAASFFEGRGTQWNYNSLKNFNAISTPVQHHLQRVYMTLAATVLLSAVGVYIHTLWNIGGIITSLLFIGASTWLAVTPSTAENENKRLQLLGAAALCEGASLGTLVGQVLQFNPSIVMFAFLGSTAIFACFTGAALLAKRREYLFLGGILSSVISMMLMMQFGSMFVGRGAFMFNVELYLGLAVFVGYVLFDTQMIIERASLGDYDYIKHTLDLFMDFVAIFVRILVIMTKNANERERKDRERRRRRD
jgi:FtsH-binding integral membrane protein